MEAKQCELRIGTEHDLTGLRLGGIHTALNIPESTQKLRLICTTEGELFQKTRREREEEYSNNSREPLNNTRIQKPEHVLRSKSHHQLGSRSPAQFMPTARKIRTSPLTSSDMLYEPRWTLFTLPTFCSTTFNSPLELIPTTTAV